MVDVGAAGGAEFAAIRSGPFSRLARGQFAALAAMRVRLFANSLRSNDGVFEMGARAVAFLVYGGMGIGLGVGAGVTAYALVSRHMWQVLPVEFWVVCFLWQAVSVALASFQEQYDLGGLLRFPVNFSSFYALCLLFGLIDASTLLGGLCSIGILIGVTIARPDLFGWTLLGLVAFGAFNILLVRAILAWIDRWLAKRRSREIVSAVFLLAMVSLQLLNPGLRERPNGVGRPGANFNARTEFASKLEPWVRTVDEVQAWLPPGLAAVALQGAGEGDAAKGAGAIGLLSLFALSAGGLLAMRLRAEYRGESLSEAPSRRKAASRETSWLIGGAGPISAVFEKELRTLTRSMPQLFALCVPMVMVFVIGNLFRTSTPTMRQPFQYALPICVAYGLLGFAQLMYNNLGAEGKGIQMLFLFPMPVRTFLMAKNLFHALLFLLIALLSGVLASVRLGTPSALITALTLAWLAFALPANLAAGNVLSLTMPYRVNLGRIGRQSGSQANALLSMLIQTTVLGVGATVIAICALLREPWFAVPILLVLAAAAVFAWLKILRNVDTMANERRDLLIGKLAKTE
jgi:ABC-2 type transport system permease protein